MSIPETIVIQGRFSGWSLDELAKFAASAEEAGVRSLVLPDDIAAEDGGEAWPDALILIGWLAAKTSRIRLLARVSTLGHQPYNLARRLASLELISRGRSGWVVDEGHVGDAYAAFSGKARLEGADFGARQQEFVDVVSGLWESWDGDALLLDRYNARFFNPQSMHTLDHRGAYFSVRGPLNVMRSPRGRPDLLRDNELGDAVVIDSARSATKLTEGWSR
ncbi:LLM class flavin-dependent oxidoreductase [Mesorhizobium sp. CAU 1741]|uniref:LLM class flavin-dependent oxidoreductase n=1 Tax=Mesorhizobium sp. CAU 1741 TaxID=3140366 RepID=UPI00325A6AE8